MAFLEAKNYLSSLGYEKRIMEFDKSSATVKEAAIAVGCMEAEIAKTLSFMVDNKAILIVTAGDAKIDNHKYKEVFKTKARMLSMEEVVNLVGHQVGGVCPFGIKDDVVVYLDESLKRFNMVYPACGSSNSAVKLSVSELEEVSNYKAWIDVSMIVE